MTPEEAKELLKKYAEGSCTPEEKILVERWYEQESAHRKIENDIADPELLKAGIWNHIADANGLEATQSGPRKIAKIVSIAASVIIILSIGLHFYKTEHPDVTVQKAKPVATDIDPGEDKAILTLADGSKISLDDKSSGVIAMQSGIRITKLPDGSLSYEISGQPTNTGQTAFNTIETPKGGKYQIVLPDGSKVWLNAASSLKFPTTFSRAERRVDLAGEAYFEVSKNTAVPFNVHTSRMNVHVTGTQFNVMAYNDESYTAATLVEGSVDIKESGQNLSLIPGEQAVSKTGKSLVKKEVDVDQAVAWKNGLFQFNDADIQSVMRQISRWYDITVEYRGQIPANRFGGYISRDSKLSQVIKMLELSGVRFITEDKKIIVLP